MTSTQQLAGRQVSAAALATFIIFGANGLVFASWAARIPAVTEILHISSGQMGTLLLCTAVGSLIALPTAGHRHQPDRHGQQRPRQRPAGRAGRRAGISASLLAESVPGTAVCALLLRHGRRAVGRVPEC